MSIKERLAKFTKPNYFSRVNAEHIINLYIGMDELSRKAIELRSNFMPKKVSGTSCIEVNQYKKDEYNVIRFSLCDDEMSGLFYMFCEDLVEQTKELKNEFDGYKTIINRYFQWKKMFISSKKDFLSEAEIMGMIGEILFLKNVLKDRIGLSNALRSWSGQELTHKDFSFENQWFEVKTINKAKMLVKISSIEQLESEYDGELEVFYLEKMSEAYDGITLNKLIMETANLFDNAEEKNDFLSKVTFKGYEYNDYYDSFVFEVSSFLSYKVDKNFPKIVRSNIPSAIKKASYEILLSDIEEFKIN